MLFALICTDKPDALQLRMRQGPSILHLESLGTALKAAGPFTEDEGKPTGSLVIIEAEDRAAAKAMAAPIPTRRPGLFASVEIRPWKWLIKNPEAAMAYWLFKSEPETWSWTQQKAKGKAGEEWTGVRNYQARNNMRAMKVGDKGFFYHSNDDKAIVGIVEVCEAAHKDPTAKEDDWDCVDIRAVQDVPSPSRSMRSRRKKL